jgi:hypothetical protein
MGVLNDLSMMPLLLKKARLWGGLQPPDPQSTSEKAALIVTSADAYHELLDSKRF